MPSVKPDYEVAASVYPDPKQLYIKDEYYQESQFKYLRGPFLGATFGSLTYMFTNWIHERPFRAGIHLCVLYGTLGAIGGHFAGEGIRRYFSYRDQVHKHYVATHPDDFPAPRKIKLADKFDPWVPVR